MHLPTAQPPADPSGPRALLLVTLADLWREQPLNLTSLPATQVVQVLVIGQAPVPMAIQSTGPVAVQIHPLPPFEPRLNSFVAHVMVNEARRGYAFVRLLAPADNVLKHAVEYLQAQGVDARQLSPTEADFQVTQIPAMVAADVQRMPAVIRAANRRRRRRVKLPTTPENMSLVMQALLKHFRLGEVYSKTQISPIIHKETRRNVKDLFPYKNLTGLYRYLLSVDLIEEVDAKSFRVINTEWQAPQPTTPAEAA